MGLRFRETRGVSWRDPRHPGQRRWRSHSVSYGPVDALLVLIGWLLIWPVIGMIWLAVEVGVFVASLILALVFMLIYRRGPQHLRLARFGRWFWIVDVLLT